MKKIIIVLSSVLFVAACMQFEKETAPEFSTNVAAPTIQRVNDPEEDPDYDFTVKIAPAAGNTYYSFAILKGDSPLDAETLLENGYAGKAVTVKLVRDSVEVDVPLSGCFNAQALKDTTVQAFKLTPNTKYTVYAVGCDELGTRSKVTTLSITTSDVTVPSVFNANGAAQFDDSDLEDGTIVLKFDDPVSFTDDLKNGKAKFYATYFGVNDATQGVFNAQFTEEVSLDSLSVDGNKVSIQVPERIPGAVVGISFDAGVVQNGVNLKNEKTSVVTGFNSKGEVDGDGVFGRFETVPFEFALPLIEDADGNIVRMPEDTIIYVQDWTSLMLAATAQDLVEPQYQEGKTFNKLTVKTAPEIRYTDGDLRKILYPATQVGVMPDSTVVFILDEDPGYGTSISFDIAAEAIEDLWGNPCEAFSSTYVDEDGNPFWGNYFTSFGYSLEDIFGTWRYDGESYSGKVLGFEDIIIAPRKPFDNPAYEEYYASRNVEIHDFFKSVPVVYVDTFENDNPVLYATFNVHSGILNIEWEILGMAAWTGYGWSGEVQGLNLDAEDGNYNFKMPKRGTLEQMDAIYINLKDLGAVDFLSGEMTKTSDDYTLPATGESVANYVSLPEKRSGVKQVKRMIK